MFSLSSFLKTGITSASFSFLGKTPVLIKVLKSITTLGAKISKWSLRILAGTESIGDDLDSFRLINYFTTEPISTFLKENIDVLSTTSFIFIIDGWDLYFSIADRMGSSLSISEGIDS